jgi:glycosyltransferase involved in cell wall biosynthesis
VAPHNKLLRNLDALIAVASNQVDYFRSFVDAAAVHVVPHGIDTDFFEPPGQRESTGRECLFVGQWLRDFDMMRDVIRSVADTGAGLTFTIVTTDENVNRFEGLHNTVVFSRLTDAELLARYQRADLLVLPLSDCTANNSVLEGMACGLPIVTTEVGGVKDYVTPACASLVASGDVEAMRDAILLLTSDEQLRARMGRESRARALRFGWGRMADELLEVFRGL